MAGMTHNLRHHDSLQASVAEARHVGAVTLVCDGKVLGHDQQPVVNLQHRSDVCTAVSACSEQSIRGMHCLKMLYKDIKAVGRSQELTSSMPPTTPFGRNTLQGGRMVIRRAHIVASTLWPPKRCTSGQGACRERAHLNMKMQQTTYTMTVWTYEVVNVDLSPPTAA